MLPMGLESKDSLLVQGGTRRQLLDSLNPTGAPSMVKKLMETRFRTWLMKTSTVVTGGAQ